MPGPIPRPAQMRGMYKSRFMKGVWAVVVAEAIIVAVGVPIVRMRQKRMDDFRKWVYMFNLYVPT